MSEPEDPPILSVFWGIFVAVFKQLYRPVGALSCYFACAYALVTHPNDGLIWATAALAGGTAFLRTKDKQTEADNVSK